MSYEYNGATISAHELTIEDEDRITSLFVLVPDEGSFTLRYRFAEFMIGADVTGELGFPLVSASSPKAEVDAAYRQWLRLPRRMVREWQAAIIAAETPAPKASPSPT